MNDYSYLPDPATDTRLLPSSMLVFDNKAELDFCKSLLPLAIDTILDDTQQHLVRAYYFQGKNQTEIAKELGVVPSAISKKLAASCKKLEPYLHFATLIWKKQHRED